MSGFDLDHLQEGLARLLRLFRGQVMIAEVVEQRGRPRRERQGLLVSRLRLIVALSGVQDDAQQAKG